MSFLDYAKINVRSGDGGNGCMAFRREKYVPLGGPYGGNGGRGGDIIFVGDSNLGTLIDFKYRNHYKAMRGEHGKGKNMHGAGASDLWLKVPLGTVIRDCETGEILADIVEHGQSEIICLGGRGGRGNTALASDKDRVPHLAEKGAPGQERWILLELKFLADIGLVGFPNAGKSTLISKVSAARPKIASYPFTTLEPNLGVVDLGEGRSFVLADLPGLIQGACQGSGLGFRFLRHIERTRIIVHVLDMSEYPDRTPWEDYYAVCEELNQYNPELASRPRIICANKMDAFGAEERLEETRKKLAEEIIIPVSALKSEGLTPFLNLMWKLLAAEKENADQNISPDTKRVVTVSDAGKREKDRAVSIKVEREAGGIWVLKCDQAEKLVIMTDLDNPHAVFRMQSIMEKLGVEKALRQAGVCEGDMVRIGKEEFEYRD